MPPRLNKRQQREQDELLELAAKAETGEEQSSEDESPAPKPAAGFATLFTPEDDEEDSVDEAARPSKSRKSKKKKSKTATPVPVDSPAPVQRATPQSKQPEITKKAAKKAKAREKKADHDELDKALAELAVKYPELQKVADAPIASGSTISSSNALASLLSVSLPHLDAEAEMKKFFGSKVVAANKTAAPGQPGGRRQGGGAQRSNLTRPQPSWWAAKAREGLTLRPLTDEELVNKGSRVHGEKWWTVEYSKQYKSMTMAFMATVMSGDPEGFWNLLAKLPWHGDTLLQLSEVYRHREEYASAVDFVDRALFTYERSFIGAFNFTSGMNRLDFDHVENRPFFLAVHRQLTDLQRRGCVRTAFEFARLLYSLDPWTDPHGALLHLDFLAIKAGMGSWLLELYKHFDVEAEHDGGVKPTALPGWAYSRALAMRLEETAKKDKTHEASTAALKEAITAFPSIAPLLADKVDIGLRQDIRSHPTMTLQTEAGYLNTTESTLHLLSHLYAQRTFPVWKTPAISAWLSENIISVYTAFPTAIPKARVRFNALYAHETPRYSVYRHIMVLETSYRRLFSYIPQHIMNAKSLACDPLPPPTATTSYDDEFFKGAEDMFKKRRKTKKELAADERMLERMIPDAVFRGQLQAFFNAQPHFQDRFPGGIIQFAQMAAQMPEDALEDMMIAGVMEGEGLAQGNGGMPGQMPQDDDDGWEEDNEEVEEDAPLVPGGDRNESSDSEDDDEEEVAPMPLRMLRNIMGRFWGGGSNAPEESSDEDDPGRAPLDTSGVD